VTGDDLELCKHLAESVLDSLARESPEAVGLLAVGLAVAEPPLSELAEPFDFYADALAYPEVDGRLARLRMAYALRVIAHRPGCERLVDRLEAVGPAPWPPLREALGELRMSLYTKHEGVTSDQT
jgi:hypothetical protein